jgi:hypothetical protein
MMKRSLALLLCALLSAPACATARGPRVQTNTMVTQPAAHRKVLAEFASQLPPGTRVKARVADNRTIRATLLKVTDTSIVLQPRTRITEPIEEVPFDQLLALEQDVPTGSNAGRTAAISAAAAAGATIGVLLILAAVFSD